MNVTTRPSPDNAGRLSAPREPSPVDDALSRLSSAINELGQAEDALTCRLSTVRIPGNTTDMPKDEMLPEVKPVTCPLEDAINTAIERIDSISTHIRKVQSQLRII